ncbi:MAG TPA: CDP-alcohol phosphatidyltransferase family protein [bacterium]|nr:CDP-alcohol phosphatidyltransferase family protein [bacterium]HQQ01258.1 CDP-alcohol phosphatidyltransferase family protein [bacterium]
MNIANALSLGRILLVPCFFWLCYYSYSRVGAPEFVVWARIVLVMIFLSDFLDGYFARRHGQETALGGLLDPLADKLFVLTSFILLAIFDRLPIWLAMIVISKDILVVIGWALVATILGRVEASPTRTSKWATAFQFAAVVATVFSFPVPYPLIVNVVAAGLTLVSVGQYFLQGLRLLSPGNSSS